MKAFTSEVKLVLKKTLCSFVSFAVQKLLYAEKVRYFIPKETTSFPLSKKNNISIIAFLWLALCFAASGCGLLQRSDEPPNEPVARVYNKYLYRTDLVGLTGENTAQADSIELVNHYIDQWIRKNVVLEAARRQMPASMPEVEKKFAGLQRNAADFPV